MNYYLITYKDHISFFGYFRGKKIFSGLNPIQATDEAERSCRGHFELEDIKLIEGNGDEADKSHDK